MMMDGITPYREMDGMGFCQVLRRCQSYQCTNTDRWSFASPTHMGIFCANKWVLFDAEALYLFFS